MKRKIVITVIMTTMLSLAACGKQTAVPEEAVKEEAVKPAEAEEIIQNEPEAKPEIEEEIIDLDKEVVFSDEYLAKEAKKNASSLTVGGLQEIAYLELNYDKITVPEELAYFTNLQGIRMNATNKGDISWLSNFPNLKYLELSYNHIDNIDVIGNYAGLVSLKIDSYNITDISFLRNLKSLEELDIGTDALQDFSPIDSLTNLLVLYLSSGAAESLNIDFSSLTDLRLISIQGSFTDLTALNSLNIYDEPTYTDGLVHSGKDYKGFLPEYNNTVVYTGLLTESYRDNYSNDKRPENECFRRIFINVPRTAITDESVKTTARINYKYLQALNFHIDEYYQLADADAKFDIYQEEWDNLIATNGDPLLKNEASTVTALPDLENFDNPKVYLDGRYLGLYCPLEDMVAGYTIKDGADALEYVNSVYVNAGSNKQIALYSGSKSIFSITVKNTESLAKPIAECEISRIGIFRNTDMELKLPQGNETKEYVSWDYPHRSFTDIYENCYTNGRNGDFDLRCYYIFCNDKCDIIEMTISKKVLDSVTLYREDFDKAESMKNSLSK